MGRRPYNDLNVFLETEKGIFLAFLVYYSSFQVGTDTETMQSNNSPVIHSHLGQQNTKVKNDGGKGDYSAFGETSPRRRLRKERSASF